MKEQLKLSAKVHASIPVKFYCSATKPERRDSKKIKVKTKIQFNG